MCSGKENYTSNESFSVCDDESDDNDNVTFVRISDDREINVFGKQLLEICKMFECVILNGLCERGFNYSCTYISSSGCSTIDYVLVSSDLCSSDFVQSFNVFPCILTRHLPVGITLKIHNGYSNTSHAKENPKSTWTGRLIWDAKKESAFLANFNSNALQKVGVRAIALIDDNVGQARAMFTSSLLRASECVKKHVPTGISRKGSLWFDDDCRMAKKYAKSWLGVLKRSGCQPDRPAYEAARKVYKIITKKKKTGCKRKKSQAPCFV